MSSFGISAALNLEYKQYSQSTHSWSAKIETVTVRTANEVFGFEFLPSGGEVVLGLVEYLFTENLSRLLGDALAQILIVDLDARHVPLVPRNDRVVPGSRLL